MRRPLSGAYRPGLAEPRICGAGDTPTPPGALTGEEPLRAYARAVSSAGYVTADGADDILIGANRHGSPTVRGCLSLGVPFEADEPASDSDTAPETAAGGGQKEPIKVGVFADISESNRTLPRP